MANLRSAGEAVGSILLLALVYFVCGKIGLSLAIVHPSATAIWAPTGIALAALLLRGYRVWPGIFLGAYLVNVTNEITYGSVGPSLGIAAGNTLEALLGSYLVNRYASGRHVFDRAHDVFRFTVLAAILSTTVSATLGLLSLALGGYSDWSQFTAIWLTWWLGDAAGAILVTPLIVLWCVPATASWRQTRLIEIVPLLLVLAFVGEVVFGGVIASAEAKALSFLCIPVLVWSAFKLGPRGTATVAFLLAMIALVGTLRGHGPFAGENANASLLLVQMFMGVASVTALSLSALVSERAQARQALQATNEMLEQRIEQRTQDLSYANERLRAEMAERQRADSKFRDLLEAAPDAMVIVNRHGTIQIINAQTEKLFGYKKEDLLGKSIELLIPARLREQHLQHRERYFVDPHVRPMGMGMDLFGLRQDGQEFPVEISLSPLQTEEGILVSGAIRDITGRKKAEQERQASEARFRRLFEANLIGIVLADLHGRVIEANPAFLNMLGYTREELLAGPVLFDHVDELIVARLRQTGSSSPWEKEYQRKDGGRISALVGVALLEGSPDMCVCFVLDISARKRAEEAMRQANLELDRRVQERTAELARSNEALQVEIAERLRAEEQIKGALRIKEVLLKEVQHRVKNNLQVVASLLSLQSGYIHDEQALEIFKESQMRVRCMATIHEKFYQSRELAKIDFADYVRNLARYLLHAYGGSAGAVALKTDVDNIFLDIDTAIPCGLIINELVTNSLKHAFPEGRSGEIHIDLRRADGDKLVLVVRDDGVSLPKEFDIKTTQSLGLQLVSTLSHQLGGTLAIDTTAGTTFTIVFAVPSKGTGSGESQAPFVLSSSAE